MIEKQELLTELLISSISKTKVGIIVRGIRGINPNKVIDQVLRAVNTPLFVSSVGYPRAQIYENETGILSDRIEDAVKWRSDPEYSGKIVAFVNEETDKLHSLAEFDVITPRSLSQWLLTNQIDKAQNEPTRNFWEALRVQSDQYTLDALIDFVEAVQTSSDVQKAIPANMWRIGLLSDPTILTTKSTPQDKLGKNRELLLKIGQLSDDSRKKMSSSLARIEDEGDKAKLKETYNNLQRFFKYGNPEILELLELSLVEKLMTASKKRPKPKKPKPDDPTPDNPIVDDIDKPVNQKEQDELVTEAIIFGSEEDVESLGDFVDKIEEFYNGEEQGQDELVHQVDGIFEGRDVQIKKIPKDLRTLVRTVCNDSRWGALIETKESNLKDAIGADKNKTNYFEPSNPNSIIGFKHENGRSSLFEFIEEFDNVFEEKGYSDTEKFGPILSELKAVRSELAPKIDLILNYPVLMFGAKPEYRDLLIRYVTLWNELLKTFSHNANRMIEISSHGTDYASKGLLLLDVLYIQTPTEWKAILLPLHPVYLWRYCEVFKMLNSRKNDLTEEEKDSLESVLNDLPQLMNFIVANNLITPDTENKLLPCSGSIEMLPTFENKTNRYLGDDGISSMVGILSRWIEYAPYSKKEVRICSVDIPNLVTNIRDIKKFMDDYSVDKVVYDVYFTRKQNGNTELSKLDYSARDYELSNYLQSGRLTIRIKNVDSLEIISQEMMKKPVHLAFFFDQSTYSIEYGPSNKNLYVTPLVITYDYDFDAMTKKGQIFPSTDMDSGLVGEYHKLIRTANLVTRNSNPRTTYNGNADMTSVVSTIDKHLAQWLVVADRDTNNYDPQNAIPIGESQFDKRAVNIWASDSSRIIDQYQSMLMNYNLYPDNSVLIDILKSFGHISSSGLISIPKYGADQQAKLNKQKGLLGTLFAASWFTKAHENSLVASLDDEKARQWLNNRKHGDERADLIGLYYDENEDSLFIQPIEVKTRDDVSDYTMKYNSNTGITEIEGHAIDQISSVVDILKEIFLEDSNSEDMFVAARREVLKYQIVTECFRNIHDAKWQEKWGIILKRAFKSRDEDGLKIFISGLLIHIQLSEADNGAAEKCINPKVDDCPIEFRRLSCTEIQSQIFEEKEKPIKLDMRDLSGKKGKNAKQEIIQNSQSFPTDNEINISDIEDEPVNNDEVQVAESTNLVDENQDKVDSAADPFILEEVDRLARDFRRSCQDYNINLASCEAKDVILGPSVVRLKFRLARGQSVNTLMTHLEDIGREMKRNGVLIQQIHNSDELYLDIPRINREKVLFKDVISRIPTQISPEQLYFPLGRTPEGKDLVKNLAEMPHMLVGGSTGSGKSVFLFTLLASLLKTHPNADDLVLILSTSKMEDFTYFEGLPHLYSGRIISDAQEATAVIRDMILAQSKTRGEMLAKAKVSNIVEYNQKMEEKMPPIVVVIDEFADLADQLDTKKEKDEFHKIVRHIAQTGRSRGIHLVVCTQRPDSKLVPGTTKGQLNGRVALRMNDGLSSRMIIDGNDAKDLQKYGDMIYQNDGERERAQGYFISVDELQDLVREIIEKSN